MINFIQGLNDSPESADEVIVLNHSSNLDEYGFTAGTVKRMNTLVENKETGILVLYEAKKRIIVAVRINEEIGSFDYLDAMRYSGAELLKTIEKEACGKVMIRGLKEHFLKEEAIAFLEGMALSQYRFEKYKKKPTKNFLTEVFLEEGFFNADQLTALTNKIKATAFVKDLVNEPVNFMDALKFSEMAEKIGRESGFTTEVLDKEKIKELKMGGLLAVNQGSETPPTFNIFTWKPEDAVNEQPLVLVGKGVMFDTGGYSIKISGNMSGMKGDMAGGAVVLGTIMALALNKVPYHVVGLVPATDNKISANALVVDDVITMYDGTTVEVQNTDAEGRLVLADALSYAKQFNPELVIDLATLTGAASAITGPYGIAMMGNSKQDMDSLQQSGEFVYERLIELPFWKEFEELLKSDVADFKNVGGKVGGASVAGKFLEHFTDYNWVHLDIAGAATIDKNTGYKQAGGTACGVRLLYDYVEKQVVEKAKKTEVRDII